VDRRPSLRQVRNPLDGTAPDREAAAVIGTRPVAPDDVERLLRLQCAHQQHVLGRPDTTRADVVDALADPDLHAASVVVPGADGALLGCALVFLDGGSGHVDVDVVVDPRSGGHLLPGLLSHALRVAASGASGSGCSHVDVDQGCYRQDTQLAGALETAGFARATTFHRLHRDLDDEVVVRVPPGVRVEPADDQDEQVLRRAHRLHSSSFQGHFGFTARPWPEWLAAHRARSDTGPLWFATLDGEDVGFLHETAQFVPDEDAGYVWRLGVERAARGRGVASALLLTAFAAMRARGRTGVLLHVDSANATGATALYESVGMRPVMVIDVWRATLPTRSASMTPSAGPAP
jgi:mycothiol synthase